MTYKQFIYECTSRTIDPELAKDNEGVRRHLLEKNDRGVCKTLDEEF